MKYQAHRGVSTEAPENTMPAVELAIEQGYEVIEMDVDVTADGVFVLLHDHPLGRTAKLPDGSHVEPRELTIGDITYEQALTYDYGIWFSSKFKGTPIPTLTQILDRVAKAGLQAKIDNKYRNFTYENRVRLYKTLAPYGSMARLTCPTIELLREALEFLPDAYYHYDGVVSDETLAELATILPKERLTVWLPIANRLTTWVKVPFADEALAAKVKAVAELGIWILSSYEDAALADRLGAEIVETNGIIKPTWESGITVDMHTHSESSHDSVCPIADMRAAQSALGTAAFAVTDHFDTESYANYDIHGPIRAAHRTADALNADGSGLPTVLKGIEIGEGFWYPAEYEKIRNLDYDVIIGSVHLVLNRRIKYAFSSIDFSAFTEEELYEYLDDYFNDMLTMFREIDFDILAHLTCPIRYITGKYGINVDLSRFAEKIDTILRETIRQGKALEVNTSGYGILGDLMPTRDLLIRYRELGGYLLTIGSDAHVSENACKYFNEAKAILRELGFKHLYYYKNRKAYPYEI